MLLDVGAGAGLIGDYLRRDFPRARYAFLEPLQSLERHLETVYGADANAAGWASRNEVDVVTLLDVIEHVPNDVTFLEDIIQRIPVGTTAIVTVPAMQILWSSWDEALGHSKRYNKKSLTRCFSGLPVRVVEVNYLFPELVPPAMLRRALRRKAEHDVDEAAFPRLPRFLNGILFKVGIMTMRLRRFLPLGTSLVAVVVRT